MKKIILYLFFCFFLVACDTESTNNDITDNSPAYVKNAKIDVENALVANVFNTTEFQCKSILLDNGVWSIGCFFLKKDPFPFLLFFVTEDKNESNPPFKYILHAVNGKAKQYAENDALKMFKIDTKSNFNVNIPNIIDMFTSRFVE